VPPGTKDAAEALKFWSSDAMLMVLMGVFDWLQKGDKFELEVRQWFEIVRMPVRPPLLYIDICSCLHPNDDALFERKRQFEILRINYVENVVWHFQKNTINAIAWKTKSPHDQGLGRFRGHKRRFKSRLSICTPPQACS
jgi:hypothetical protein